MLKHINKQRRKGQSTLEYAILIIIIIGALLSIQVYVKRGVQGRFKSAADDIGDQFSPGNTNVIKVITTSSSTKDTFKSGVTTSTLTNAETTTESMNSEIINLTQEFWG
jgi:cytoskeletal protein RodZ